MCCLTGVHLCGANAVQLHFGKRLLKTIRCGIKSSYKDPTEVSKIANQLYNAVIALADDPYARSALCKTSLPSTECRCFFCFCSITTTVKLAQSPEDFRTLVKHYRERYLPPVEQLLQHFTPPTTAKTEESKSAIISALIKEPCSFLYRYDCRSLCTC